MCLSPLSFSSSLAPEALVWNGANSKMQQQRPQQPPKQGVFCLQNPPPGGHSQQRLRHWQRNATSSNKISWSMGWRLSRNYIQDSKQKDLTSQPPQVKTTYFFTLYTHVLFYTLFSLLNWCQHYIEWNLQLWIIGKVFGARGTPVKMKPKPAGFEFDEVDVSKILRPNSHRKYIQVGSTIPHLLCRLIFYYFLTTFFVYAKPGTCFRLRGLHRPAEGYCAPLHPLSR